MSNQPTTEFPAIMREIIAISNNDKTVGELLIALFLKLASLDVIPYSVATESINAISAATRGTGSPSVLTNPGEGMEPGFEPEWPLDELEDLDVFVRMTLAEYPHREAVTLFYTMYQQAPDGSIIFEALMRMFDRMVDAKRNPCRVVTAD